MSSKFLSLITGVSALALAGAAFAAEPVQLSDTQMDEVTAGRYTNYVKNFKRINVDIYTDVDLDDNYAQGDAVAEAYGNRTLAETFTYSKTTPWSSKAASSSTSATD